MLSEPPKPAFKLPVSQDGRMVLPTLQGVTRVFLDTMPWQFWELLFKVLQPSGRAYDMLFKVRQPSGRAYDSCSARFYHRRINVCLYISWTSPEAWKCFSLAEARGYRPVVCFCSSSGKGAVLDKLSERVRSIPLYSRSF